MSKPPPAPRPAPPVQPPARRRAGPPPPARAQPAGPAAPPGEAPGAGAEGGDGFGLEIACPTCAAPVRFGEADLSLECRFCGSLLVLGSPGEELCFDLPARVAGPEQVVAALSYAHAQEEIARRRAAARAANQGEPPLVPDWVFEEQARELEADLRASLEIVRLDTLLVPYRVGLGDIAQAFVGRRPDGTKDTCFRVYAIEQTLRGYDAAALNLRDQGLRIALGGLRLLLPSAVAAGRGRFLAVDPALEAPGERAQRLAITAQDRGLAPASPPRGVVLHLRQARVYKPLLLVDYRIERTERSILLDAVSGLVAGHLDPGEHEQMLAPGLYRDPQPQAVDRLVRVFPSRCPVCGHDQHLNRRALLQLCATCNRALALGPGGLGLQAYRVADLAPPGGDRAWLPFWTFRFTIRAPDGTVARSVPEWLAGIEPRFGRPSAGADRLALPAVRAIGHARLDDVFTRLAFAVTHGPPAWVHDGPLPPDTPGIRLPVTLSEADARTLLPLVLYRLLDQPRRSRINVPLTRRWLAETTLEASEPELLLLGVPVTEGRVALAGETIDLGLLADEPASLGLCQRLRFPL